MSSEKKNEKKKVTAAIAEYGEPAGDVPGKEANYKDIEELNEIKLMTAPLAEYSEACRLSETAQYLKNKHRDPIGKYGDDGSVKTAKELRFAAASPLLFLRGGFEKPFFLDAELSRRALQACKKNARRKKRLWRKRSQYKKGSHDYRPLPPGKKAGGTQAVARASRAREVAMSIYMRGGNARAGDVAGVALRSKQHGGSPPGGGRGDEGRAEELDGRGKIKARERRGVCGLCQIDSRRC